MECFCIATCYIEKLITLFNFKIYSFLYVWKKPCLVCNVDKIVLDAHENKTRSVEVIMKIDIEHNECRAFTGSPDIFFKLSLLYCIYYYGMDILVHFCGGCTKPKKN